MDLSASSLIPPLVVLVCGFWTRRVLLSLTCGILTAGLIATNFAPISAITLVSSYFWSNTELANLTSWQTFWNGSHMFIALFLVLLGIIVTLIGHSGGAYAYGRTIRKYVHTKKGVESSALALSSCLFIDDYFNSLTVGAVMHSVTDTFKIPRVKLAFLVDSMAAPVAILAPISSWTPFILGQLHESGIVSNITPSTKVLADPFFVYIGTLPFIFYSFLTILSGWFIVRYSISFGEMGRHEAIAEETGNLFGGKKRGRLGIRSPHERNMESLCMADFIIPIVTLLVSVIICILYTGDYYLLGGGKTLLEALQHTKAELALFIGGCFTLLVSFILLFVRKKIHLIEVPHILFEGTALMGPAIIILLLSWTLGDLLREDLLTGQYLAHIMIGSINVKFFPVMFFLTAAATSFALGSAWGTIAIMFPIAVPMLIQFLGLSTPASIHNLELLFPTLGAILSGAVSGDHISPISDTTIMSSTSTGCHHIDHVTTQLTYSLPVLVASAIAFLMVGILIDYPWWITVGGSLGIGIIISFASLKFLDMRSKK
jgi:Na+/H+ antiporter NhaC